MARSLFSLILFFIFLQNSYAQDSIRHLFKMSLEELMDVRVKSISFFETTSKSAPGYSYIVNMDDIGQTNVRTLEQVINQFVPGNIVGRHAFHGSLHGVRGLLIDNDAKTVVMYDGLNINQRCFHGYPFGFRSPLTGNISDIEIINGPGAIKHGSGAINGFINIIPKTGSNNPGFFVRGTHGFQEKLWEAETGYGKKFGPGKDIYMYAGISQAGGFKPDDIFNHQFPDGLRSSLIDSVKNYDVHGNTLQPLIKLSMVYNHNNFSLNTFYDQILTPSNTFSHPGHFRQRMFVFNPKYTINLNEYDDLEMSVSASLFDHNFYLLDLQGEFAPLGKFGEAGGRENHFQGKALYKTKRFSKHDLAAGLLVAKRQFEEKKQYFSDNLAGDFAIADTHWEEYSIFFEDVMTLFPGFSVSAGLRYDYTVMNDINDFKPENQERLSPRLAAAYEFTKSTIKASFQQGFRYPDAGYYPRTIFVNSLIETFSDSDKRIKLKPEHSDNLELNYQIDFRDVKLQVNANAFFNNYHNTLSYVFYKPGDDYIDLTREELDLTDSVMTFNTSSMNNLKQDFSTYGGELAMVWQPFSKLRFQGNYSYVRFNNIEPTSIRYPNHLVKLNLTASPYKKYIVLYLNLIYRSGFDIEKNGFDPVYEDGRTVVNASISAHPVKRLSLILSAINLFKQDKPPVVFQGFAPSFGGLGFNERFIYLTVKYKFAKQ